MPVGAGSVNSQCMGSSVRCQSPTAYENGENGAHNWHVHCADVAISNVLAVICTMILSLAT